MEIAHNAEDFISYISEPDKKLGHRTTVKIQYINDNIYYRIIKACDLCSHAFDEVRESPLAWKNKEYEKIKGSIHKTINMKPQLIDNVSTDTKAEFKVEVWNNKFYNTWKYAKPLNYNYDLLTKLKHAYYVLTGKAYAFRFFEDFTEQEKSQYIKSDIKSRVAEHKMKWCEKIVSEIEIEEESIKKDVVAKQEKKAELRRRKAKIVEENKNKPKPQILKKKTVEKVDEKPIYANPEITYLQYEFSNEMIAEVEKYLSAGVRREKIHVTNMPSICKWSHTRAKVVDGSKDSYDLVKQEDGNLKMDISNIAMVSLTPHKRLDVKKINNSQGIIITQHSGNFYRFNYIPKP